MNFGGLVRYGKHRARRHIAALFVALCIWVGLMSEAWGREDKVTAQIDVKAHSDDVLWLLEWPVTVRLSGYLYAAPTHQDVVAVVTLRFADGGITYPFAITMIEVVDGPSVIAQQLLQLIEQAEISFDFGDSSEMLAHVVEASPGTPLTVTGVVTPRLPPSSPNPFKEFEEQPTHTASTKKNAGLNTL